MSLGKGKLKTIKAITAHVLEWLKSKKLKPLTVVTVSENAEQEGLSFTAGGNVESRSHSGKAFGSSLQIQTVLPYNPANILLGIYQTDLKLLSIHTLSCEYL